MDQVTIGRFIAELRKEQGLTQEKLGSMLGVTNKTVSRWENGNYMPDIEMLSLLGETFNVSINELLAGQRLSDGQYRQTAEKNIAEIMKKSPFTRAEHEEFWKDKWKKEHIFAFVLVCAAVLAAILLMPRVFSISSDTAWCFLPLIAVVLYAVFRNRMMVYVESRVYDRNIAFSEKSPEDGEPQ